MTNGWHSLRLKHLARSVVEKAGVADDRPYVGLDAIASWTGEINLSASEKTKESTGNRFDSGDVLLGKLRPYLAKVAAPKFSGQCTSEALVLRPRSNIDSRFLQYRLLEVGTIEAIDASTYGAKMPRASWDFIGNLRFAVPDLSTQKTIAHFLDRETARIDQLIEKKRRLVELLREKEGVQNTWVVIRGLDPSVDLAPTGVEWVPKAPAHWRVRRIATLFRESRETGEEGLPVLSVSINWGISDRELDDDDRHRIVNQIEDKTAYKRVRPGDLVYNMMRAWQGAFGVATLDGLVSPAYVVARPSEEIYSLYFESLLRTSMCIEEFRRASKGIADFRQRLYWEHFRQVSVVLPPLEEQRRIAKKVGEVSQTISKVVEPIELSVNRLREFRVALIAAAVTGEIDVATWRKRGETDRRLDQIQDGMAKSSADGHAEAHI